MAKNIRTRNIATDNIVKLNQSDLVNFAKGASEVNIHVNDAVAYSAGNRQTVKTVNYSAYDDGLNVFLVPVYIVWTYELDALNQAERIELANMRKQLDPLAKLHNQGVLDSATYEASIKALVNLDRFNELQAREGEKAVQTAKFETSYTARDLLDEYFTPCVMR